MNEVTPLSQTDIANLALMEVGSQLVDSIDNQNATSALACKAAFWQAVAYVGRQHEWNCLKKRQNLPQLSLPGSTSSANTAFGWPGCQPSSPPPYWTATTVYTGGTLVTYGEAIYYCLQGYTSSSNFINDLTAGFWAQIYSSFFGGQVGASGGLYEWKFGYALPQDFLLLVELNGQDCRWRRGVGDLYELFINQTKNADGTTSNGKALFCNTAYADIKYTALITDTTVWDPAFLECVVLAIAIRISTQLRGDDGVMALRLNQKFRNETLPNAKTKDANEGKPRRYDPTRESDFLRSRYGSTAG